MLPWGAGKAAKAKANGSEPDQEAGSRQRPPTPGPIRGKLGAGRRALGDLSQEADQSLHTTNINNAKRPLDQEPRVTKRRASSIDTMEIEPAAAEELPAEMAQEIDRIVLDQPPNDDADADDAKATTDYMSALERKRAVPAGYIAAVQPTITPAHRAELLDWLVQVHKHYGYCPETLFLAVHVLDSFLCHVPLSRRKLQLAGMSALSIAAKYEEVEHRDSPGVQDYLYVSNDSYTRSEMVAMEGIILSSIDYALGTPTPIHWFNIATATVIAGAGAATATERRTAALGAYALELGACSYETCGFLPSELAAAAIHLAQLVIQPNRASWLGRSCGHEQDSEQMLSCIKSLATVMRKAATSEHQAIRRKYGTGSFYRVSKMNFYETARFVDGL